mmetsp:Transcript_32368/g.71771  ORF Transcript_32368/g.71771 Transcript_32368/m.71771 type:complete len:834 (-) Transcript_32368:87-2588(-)
MGASTTKIKKAGDWLASIPIDVLHHHDQHEATAASSSKPSTGPVQKPVKADTSRPSTEPVQKPVEGHGASPQQEGQPQGPAATRHKSPRPSSRQGMPSQFGPGASVEYFSQSQQRWIPALVKSSDQVAGTYELDVHPAAEASRVRARALAAPQVPPQEIDMSAAQAPEQCQTQLAEFLGTIAPGVVWEDPKFPPTAESLCWNWAMQKRAEGWRKLVWRRLPPGHRVFPDGGLHPADIKQGSVGNCYFLASLSALAHRGRELAERLVITSPQAEKAGVAICRLNWHGRWTSIVVSHTFPCTAWKTLAFAQAERGASWVALLEKAWAKLHGSYQAIEGGLPWEGLRAFTGAPTRHQRLEEARVAPISSKVITASKILDDETYTANTGSFIQGAAGDSSDGIWSSLLKAKQRGYITCTNCGAREQHEQEWLDEDTGLVHGHSYTMLDARVINGSPYVLLRNPWGRGMWKGQNAQGASDWPSDLKRCAGNGVFWMAYQDFIKNFQSVDICRFQPGFECTSQNLQFSQSGSIAYAGMIVTTSVASDPVSLSVLQRRPPSIAGTKVQDLWCPVGVELFSMRGRPQMVTSSPYMPRQEVSVEAVLQPGVDYLLLVRVPAARQAEEKAASRAGDSFKLCTYAPGYVEVRCKPLQDKSLDTIMVDGYEGMARKSDQVLFEEDGSSIRAWAAEHRQVFVVLLEAGSTPLLAHFTWHLKNILFQADALEPATIEDRKKGASTEEFNREHTIELPPRSKQLVLLTWLDPSQGFQLGYTFLAATKPCTVCGRPVGCPIPGEFTGEYMYVGGNRFVGATGFIHKECHNVGRVAQAGLKKLRPRRALW